MSTERFVVSNVKCDGCVTNIKAGLQDFPGITEVQVDVASGQVDVSGANLQRGEVQNKLAELGYPVC